MDDLEPPAAGPRMIIDHPTTEVAVDDNRPSPPTNVPTTSSSPPSTRLQVATAPRSGVTYLVDIPSTLLLKDEDVRPQWLTTAIKDFFAYVPCVGNLGRVVGLFLAQEARLGYPQSVGISSSVISALTFFAPVTPTRTPFCK